MRDESVQLAGDWADDVEFWVDFFQHPFFVRRDKSLEPIWRFYPGAILERTEWLYA